MSIACIGWGSLIWDPRELPMIPPWNEDGPMLPVEYLRHSVRSETVTLVLDPSALPVQSLWVRLGVTDVAQAREALRSREGTVAKYIGYWSPDDSTASDVTHTIATWAAQHDVIGVVWTALPPKWNDENGIVPNVDQVLRYLRGRGAGSRAERYIRKTPAQVRTVYRTRIESELGWRHSP